MDESPRMAGHALGQARIEPGRCGYLFRACTLLAECSGQSSLVFSFNLFSWKAGLFRSTTTNRRGLIGGGNLGLCLLVCQTAAGQL